VTLLHILNVMSNIYEAILSHDIEAVRRCLAKGESANLHRRFKVAKRVPTDRYQFLPTTTDTNSYYEVRLTEYAPLHLAVVARNLKIAKLLVEHGASTAALLSGDGKDDTPLAMAIRFECRDLVEYLAPLTPIRKMQWGREQTTHLMIAAEYGCAWAIKILVAAGAINAEARNCQGWTALYIAVTTQNYEVVKALLDVGANPDAKPPEEHDLTPVNLVAMTGDTQCLALLLQAGANPSSRDEHARTPLLTAIAAGHLGAAKLLVKHGASLKETSFDGITCLHVAVTSGRIDAVRWVLAQNAVRLDGDAVQKSPLSLSCETGQAAIALVLLEAGADPNHLGIYLDDDATLLFGVRLPVRVSALFYAVKSGKQSIVELLLQGGANCAAAIFGKTSVDIVGVAMKKGHKRLAKFLQQQLDGAQGSGGSAERRTASATTSNDFAQQHDASKDKGVVERCANPLCNAIATAHGKNLKRCSGCRAAKYCSVECQRTHWQVHKPICKLKQQQSAQPRS
jgi:ankyrin repeat protein